MVIWRFVTFHSKVFKQDMYNAIQMIYSISKLMSNVLQKECILKIKLRITKINNSIIDIRNITYESIDHISICHILARLECPSNTDWSSNGDQL